MTTTPKGPLDGNEYVTALGKILSNLQSLEFALRARLSYDDPPQVQLSKGRGFYDLKTGDRVPVNSFTSYETLSQLIERYNRQIGNSDPDLTVDPDLVTLRDALAHGRSGSFREDEDNTLLKFSRPENGQVTVTFAQRLTREWLTSQVRRVYSELLKVMQSMERARA